MIALASPDPYAFLCLYALLCLDKLSPTQIIKNTKDLKVGILEDGRIVKARAKSSDGRPTLEITKKIGKKERKETEIRYTELPSGFSSQGAIEPIFGLF